MCECEVKRLYKLRMKKLREEKIKLYFSLMVTYFTIFIINIVVFYLLYLLIMWKFQYPKEIITKLQQSKNENLILITCALLPLLLTAIVTFKGNYNTVVTTARIEWCENVRDTFQQFLYVCTDQYNKSKNVKKFYYGPKKRAYCNELKVLRYENSREIKSLSDKIHLYFNPISDEDKKILDQVDDLVDYIGIRHGELDKEIYYAKKNKLVEDISLYLKEEWEKIKYESR